MQCDFPSTTDQQSIPNDWNEQEESTTESSATQAEQSAPLQTAQRQNSRRSSKLAPLYRDDYAAVEQKRSISYDEAMDSRAKPERMKPIAKKVASPFSTETLIRINHPAGRRPI